MEAMGKYNMLQQVLWRHHVFSRRWRFPVSGSSTFSTSSSGCLECNAQQYTEGELMWDGRQRIKYGLLLFSTSQCELRSKTTTLLFSV